MRFTKFQIKNFKGIKNTEVSLNELGQGRIFTLVGLNECGKTTLLEAINSFSPDDATQPLYLNDVFRKVQPEDLVPKHRKDNFTDNVEITAFLEFTEDDLNAIEHYFMARAIRIDVARISRTLKVTKHFTFEQSEYRSEGTTWWLDLWVKIGSEEEFRQLEASSPLWVGVHEFIRTLIPTICYFPTFLFQFPSRVYLSHTPPGLEPQNSYYKQIVQDVLDSLDRDLNIKDSIVDRVEKIEEGKLWNRSDFLQSDRRRQVDAVMNLLGNQISRSVFTRWNEIFQSRFTKSIDIEWGIDDVFGSAPIYLSFSVRDGTSTYSIEERSLGFRWFFCFLLFTHFRKSRSGSGTLFLLDEPASNLHATAQKQLLASFEAVTDKNNYLIYSTHSHYMINPKWLEGAFIVRNAAIDYEGELAEPDEFHNKETDIRIIPYKRFVGVNADKTTYYQPILDALDYVPAILEHQARTVMVEGKSDFYFLSYFKDVVFAGTLNACFLPSSGANDLGPLISLYLGWRYSFKILLDDDSAGCSAKKRYRDKWFLADAIVETIGDIHSDLSGMKLEDLVSKNDKDQIKTALGLGSSKLTKKQMARFFQDRLASGEKFDFDANTMQNIQLVFDTLTEYFGNNT